MYYWAKSDLSDNHGDIRHDECYSWFLLEKWWVNGVYSCKKTGWQIEQQVKNDKVCHYHGNPYHSITHWISLSWHCRIIENTFCKGNPFFRLMYFFFGFYDSLSHICKHGALLLGIFQICAYYLRSFVTISPYLSLDMTYTNIKYCNMHTGYRYLYWTSTENNSTMPVSNNEKTIRPNKNNLSFLFLYDTHFFQSKNKNIMERK